MCSYALGSHKGSPNHLLGTSHFKKVKLGFVRDVLETEDLSGTRETSFIYTKSFRKTKALILENLSGNQETSFIGDHKDYITHIRHSVTWFMRL